MSNFDFKVNLCNFDEIPLQQLISAAEVLFMTDQMTMKSLTILIEVLKRIKTGECDFSKTIDFLQFDKTRELFVCILEISNANSKDKLSSHSTENESPGKERHKDPKKNEPLSNLGDVDLGKSVSLIEKEIASAKNTEELENEIRLLKEVNVQFRKKKDEFESRAKRFEITFNDFERNEKELKEKINVLEGRLKEENDRKINEEKKQKEVVDDFFKREKSLKEQIKNLEGIVGKMREGKQGLQSKGSTASNKSSVEKIRQLDLTVKEQKEKLAEAQDSNKQLSDENKKLKAGKARLTTCLEKVEEEFCFYKKNEAHELREKKKIKELDEKLSFLLDQLKLYQGESKDCKKRNFQQKNNIECKSVFCREECNQLKNTCRFYQDKFTSLYKEFHEIKILLEIATDERDMLEKEMCDALPGFLTIDFDCGKMKNADVEQSVDMKLEDELSWIFDDVSLSELNSIYKSEKDFIK